MPTVLLKVVPMGSEDDEETIRMRLTVPREMPTIVVGQTFQLEVEGLPEKFRGELFVLEAIYGE